MNRTPVVFVHGTWLHALSWESWTERFAGRGYPTLAPGWPGEAATAEEVRRSPAELGGLGLEELTEHYAGIVRSFAVPPVIVGHSVGGLIAQHLIGAGLGRAAVALAATPVNEVALPAPPVMPEAAARADAVVPLSAEEFHKALANTVSAEESDRLHERYAIPAPRRLLADLGCAGGPRSPLAEADPGNTGRGPLLLVSGQEDRLVPDAVTRAVYRQYGDSTAVTDLKQYADGAHSLVIDHGWRQVADHVLGWLDDQGVRPFPGGD